MKSILKTRSQKTRPLAPLLRPLKLQSPVPRLCKLTLEAFVHVPGDTPKDPTVKDDTMESVEDLPGEVWEHYIVKDQVHGYKCTKCGLTGHVSDIREKGCKVPKPGAEAIPPPVPKETAGLGASAAVVGREAALKAQTEIATEAPAATQDVVADAEADEAALQKELADLEKMEEELLMQELLQEEFELSNLEAQLLAECGVEDEEEKGLQQAVLESLASKSPEATPKREVDPEEEAGTSSEDLTRRFKRLRLASASFEEPKEAEREQSKGHGLKKVEDVKPADPKDVDYWKRFTVLDGPVASEPNPKYKDYWKRFVVQRQGKGVVVSEIDNAETLPMEVHEVVEAPEIGQGVLEATRDLVKNEPENPPEAVPAVLGREIPSDPSVSADGREIPEVKEEDGPSRPAVLDKIEPVMPSEQQVPKKRGRKPKQDGNGNSASEPSTGGSKKVEEKAEEREPSKKRASRSKKVEEKAEETEPSKKRSRGKKVEEKVEVLETPKRRTSSRSKKVEEKVEEPEPSKKRRRGKNDEEKVEEPEPSKKRSRCKKTDSPEEREPGPALSESGSSSSKSGRRSVEFETGEKAVNDKKKRQSRKSSAYHTAKAKALKDGKSAEEATHLAKIVPLACSFLPFAFAPRLTVMPSRALPC